MKPLGAKTQQERYRSRLGVRPGLQTQLILVLLLVSVTGLVTVGLVSSRTIEAQFKKIIAKNAHNIALTLSKNPQIGEAVAKGKDTGLIQETAEKVRRATGVKAVIVSDAYGRILSHPVTYRLGETLIGNNTKAVHPVEGVIGTKEMEGRLGASIRAEAPIFHEGQQVGKVYVDVLVNEIRSTQFSLYGKLILALFVGLAVSVTAAVILARKVKGIIRGMEPGEIALLLNQRESILESIREAIIAVDSNTNVVLTNSAARKLFSIGADIVGQPVEPVIPGTGLPEVLRSKEAEYDREVEIGGRRVMAQRIPLKGNGRTVGAIGSFRDLTEVRTLAEQITGVTMYVEALRAQNHEFQNKLQTISGLIQLEEYDRAVSFISEVAGGRHSQISFIARRIKNPSLGGILLGKSSRCAELGIDFRIFPDSSCGPLEELDGISLVIIVGNLIDNAIESVSELPQQRRKVEIGVFDESNRVLISVRDNGNGISPKIIHRIFERGFSTKPQNGKDRGYGLYNVQLRVEAMKGDIEVDSVPGVFTEFVVSLPNGSDTNE
ncbi:MAG: ATP-binding protein [Thermovirgaceae bacterium]